MAGNGRVSEGLTTRQQKALAALLEEPTLTKAAKAAGVGERTLFTWLNEPTFSAAYREARGQLLENTLTALQSASGKAVETLRAVLSDQMAKPGEKVSAARAILEFSLKAREVLEVEERLHALEERLRAQEAAKGKATQWR